MRSPDPAPGSLLKCRTQQSISAIIDPKCSTPALPETNSQSHQRGLLWLAIGLAAVTALAFAPCARHGFVNYDDVNYVTANQHVLGGLTRNNIAWAYTTFEQANWHPLTWLSLQMDASVGGPRPLGFHATNVVLHAVTAGLLFWLLARTTTAVWPSMLAACLFAWHPLRVESVAWVAERKDVLSGLFGILALCAYARYAARPNRIRFALVAALLALGLMAKPMLVTLPLIMLLMDYWPLVRRERLAALVREKLPLFLLVGISAGITLYAQWTGGSVRSLDKVTLSYRVGNALISTVEYCRKLIWPSDLTVFYPHRTPGIARLCFCAAFFATVTGVAAWQYRARPQVLVGWLWFLIMLLPVCGLIQVGDQALADRYTYLPSIGLCIGVAWTLGEIASGWRYRRLLVFASTALVLALFITLTERQLGHWHDSLALWRHAIDIGEPSVLAYQKLGMAYLDQGAQADAIENFEQALRLDADDPTTLCNLGGAYVQRGDVDIGLRHLRRAVRVDPANINAWYNLGVLASKDHHPELARTYYERALAVKPDYWPAHLNLGLDALTQNDAGRALGHLHEAAAINPLSAQAICFLGVAHEYLGQTNDALRCYQEAARLNPQLTIAAQRLARVESRQLAKEPGK